MLDQYNQFSNKLAEEKKKGREVLGNYEAEVVIEIQEDPETVQPDIDRPKVPLSARAARQAAIAAGLYITNEDEDEEEDRVSVNDEDEEREEEEEAKEKLFQMRLSSGTRPVSWQLDASIYRPPT